METTRIQTVLRLRPDLLERVKRNARREHRSFNSYVERLLDRETGELVFPVLPPDFSVSEEIRGLRCASVEAPSAEQLAADPKLAYLWEKYGDAQD